jgi:hypothetical protein
MLVGPVADAKIRAFVEEAFAASAMAATLRQSTKVALGDVPTPA